MPPSSPPATAAPTLSVVLPFFNNPAYLERCLAALRGSDVPFELILVDDCSTDERARQVAQRSGGQVLRLERNSGPAVARNAGARVAAGAVLAFVDSDVVVETDTLRKLRQVFEEEPAVAACFGSYDDQPDSRGIVTEYRNLLHHFVHQNGPREATTFWAGCGAVRSALFRELGGFDEAYARPSIEDIELGMRIKRAGGSIRLRPDIQCKHLKRWRFLEMIRVDVERRAIPWTHLLLERPETGGDLNLQASQKLCVALVFLALATLALIPALGWARGLWTPWWIPAAWIAPVLWINRRLYGLFLRHRGPLFALAGIGLHFLYYLYSGLAYLYAHVTHARTSRTPSSAR
jgi:GT2 family glycosyltransferase